MAGQAGWYRAPGEEGVLRWWNGSMWTDHRQQDPAAVDTPEEQRPAVDPDPMAEYERQFDTPSLPDDDCDGADYDFDLRAFDASPTPTKATESSPQPQYRPQTPVPVVPAAAPEFAGRATGASHSLGPIALGPASPAPTPVIDAPESELDRKDDDGTALTAAPKATAAPAPRIDRPPVVKPVVTGIAPHRKAIMGAVRIMAAAVLIILLGVAAMLILSFQSTAGTGEVETNAIVTSLGARTADSCTPVARFAVVGKSYTAKSSAAISPCPIGLGESVDVVYSAANPASAAQIEVGSSAGQYLWMVPIVGGLIFVGGLITFIVRAGSIVGGVTLLREGREPREPLVSRP